MLSLSNLFNLAMSQLEELILLDFEKSTEILVPSHK